LGTFELQDAWTIEDTSGVETTAADDDLIYGGAMVQIPSNDGVFQYGFESGGLLTFRNKTSYFVTQDAGLTVRVAIKNELWIMDLALGGFVSVRPWRQVRFYASAGPSFFVGSLDIGDDDVSVQPLSGINSNVAINTSGRKRDSDLGFYGRIGAEVILDSGYTFGVSARQINSQLDFDENGTIGLDDIQYFLTIGQSF